MTDQVGLKVDTISRVIELKDVQKNYRIGESDFPVLKGIDLNVEEGEFIALMGPSGSGKSTLLNIIGCLDRPTSGRFLLLGQEISLTSDDELARIRREELGFVLTRNNHGLTIWKSRQNEKPTKRWAQ